MENVMAEREKRAERYGIDPEQWTNPSDPSNAATPHRTDVAPGFGAHGTGYGPQGGSQTGSFGAYGEHARVSRNYMQSGASHEPAPMPARGPKNYQRSDDRIKEDIYDKLMHDHRINADEVVIEVSAGIVTLLGSVAHRQMKHWIEDIAADCAGVKDVENKLRVAITATGPT
jgi:hypothetical protein